MKKIFIFCTLLAVASLTACEEIIQDAPSSVYQMNDNLLYGTWASVLHNGEAVATADAQLVTFGNFSTETISFVKDTVWTVFPTFNFFISGERLVSIHKDENGITVLSDYQIVFLDKSTMAWRLISYAEDYAYIFDKTLAQFKRTTTADYSTFILGTWGNTTSAELPSCLTFNADGTCASKVLNEGEWETDEMFSYKMYGTFLTMHSLESPKSDPMAFWLTDIVHSSNPQKITFSYLSSEGTNQKIQFTKYSE